MTGTIPFPSHFPSQPGMVRPASTADRYRGAFLAYRVALWHPDLVTHVFTVCVPYAPPIKTYMPIEEMVAKITPHFGYQVQFIRGELEKLRSKEEMKLFLSTLYGGRTPDGEIAFDVHDGVLVDKMARVQPSRLLSEEVS